VHGNKEKETKRTCCPIPNNKTTTDFRTSEKLWSVLLPLLPVHVNTRRLDGENRLKRSLLAEFGLTAHIRGRGEEARELAQEAGKRARR
jgi:hypothetical protein